MDVRGKLEGIKVRLETERAELAKMRSGQHRGFIAGIFDNLQAIAFGVGITIVVVGLMLILNSGIKNASAPLIPDNATQTVVNATFDKGTALLGSLPDWAGIVLIGGVVVLVILLLYVLRGSSAPSGNGRK